MTYIAENERDASRAAVVSWFRTRCTEHETQACGLLKGVEAQCSLRGYAAAVIGLWKTLRNVFATIIPWRVYLISIFSSARRAAPTGQCLRRWARGGSIVSLSKPRLSRWLFDLCIVRGHEGSRNSQRMIATRDLLPQPGRPHSPFTAVSLVIIGGPASEYASARKAAGGP